MTTFQMVMQLLGKGRLVQFNIDKPLAVCRITVWKDQHTVISKVISLTELAQVNFPDDLVANTLENMDKELSRYDLNPDS